MMALENHHKLKTLVFIPARGGSKGVPRKALSLLGAMPLIAYTIRDALAIEGVTKVFVSTDDPEIQAASIQYGAEVPFLRPEHLAQDDSNLSDAVTYSYDWYRENEGFADDIFIAMSPTHPFRRPNRVNDALKLRLRNPEIFNVGSISPATVFLDNCWIKENGSIKRFHGPSKAGHVPEKLYQSAFSFNIVFDCRAHLPNRRIPVVLNEIESIDIDDPQDLELARMVVDEGLYPFDEPGDGGASGRVGERAAAF